MGYDICYMAIYRIWYDYHFRGFLLWDMIWYMLAQRRRNFEMYRQNLDPQKLEDLAHDSHHHVSCLASRQAWPVCLFSWELWSDPSLLPGGVCLPPVSWHLWGQKAADGAHSMLQGGAPVCEVKGYKSYNSNNYRFYMVLCRYIHGCIGFANQLIAKLLGPHLVYMVVLIFG